MKKSIPFFLIILLVFLLSVSFFWIYEAKIFVGRASVSQTTFSVDNSYVFATPLRAKANSQEKIRVTVFVLNNQGLGVVGKQVIVGHDFSLPLNIEGIQTLTDQLGKAVFDISSNSPGEYYLEVKVEGVTLPQKVRLSFY
ncbi:MAG: Ig-like domain-containing protein [Candidatus Cloacimonetes bacterium]|nr:Ig-like domain-containing protein [Candidatus Cloacimonadota bacterium]